MDAPSAECRCCCSRAVLYRGSRPQGQQATGAIRPQAPAGHRCQQATGTSMSGHYVALGFWTAPCSVRGLRLVDSPMCCSLSSGLVPGSSPGCRFHHMNLRAVCPPSRSSVHPCGQAAPGASSSLRGGFMTDVCRACKESSWPALVENVGTA